MRFRDGEIVAVFLDPLSQRRRGGVHILGVGVADDGLLFGDRSEVDFSRRFLVTGQREKSEAGDQRRFPVALAFLRIDHAEAAESVLVFPTVNAAHDELLKGLKLEGRAIAEEADDARGRVLIEVQPAGGAILQVVEMTLYGQEYEPAGGNVSGQHIETVARERRNPTARLR